MSVAPSGRAREFPRQFGLVGRLGILAGVWAAETLLLSYLIQAVPLDALTGIEATVRVAQHWLFRFMIAYAASFAILASLRGRGVITALSSAGLEAPIRSRYWALHLALLIPFAVLSSQLYAATSTASFAMLAVAWHGCALAAAFASLAAMAPLRIWTGAARHTAPLAVFALAPALAAVAAIKASQWFWTPAARLTFDIVVVLLRPLCPSLYANPSSLTVGTSRFVVMISDVCSGLEGVGLMLAFCAAWLWYFRRDYYFPRVLIIVPCAVLLIFLLNAIRIAAIVLIGDAGQPQIAMVGFHSQAGWIAFNLAAFGVAMTTRRSTWLSRTARAPAAHNATAAYLMPLLGILAAGMFAYAMSAGFDLFYPLRLLAAIVALWAYRDTYKALDWTFSWRGPVVGAAVFFLWILCTWRTSSAATAPDALTALPLGARLAWIGCRIAAAITTVPIAEELAYRGFLMRRLVDPDFTAVPLQRVGWLPIAISSVAFGISHGALWLPGILAGLGYGALAARSGTLAEAIAAHTTSNIMLAGYVMAFGQWQLW